MNPPRTSQLLATMTLLLFGAANAETSPSTPYAGQQHRAIKSLSDSEVAGLLAGHGAGFAKAAELNGYPGPAHVLELSSELHLSDEQARATRDLMSRHKHEAARLGAVLVEAERELDGLFLKREANAEAVDKATARIGQIQAQLRAEHLKTHLAQTALLNPHQIQRYASLRGYDAAAGAVTPARPHGHSSTHRH